MPPSDKVSAHGMPADLARRLRLLVIADADAAAGPSLVEIVRATLDAGAPAVQLRAKNVTTRAMTELALLLREETWAAGALFFVNDRVDVALAAGADGAHLGDDDLPLAHARRITPPGFLLGRSAESVPAAIQAQQEGADYLGVGSVYLTASKTDAGSPIGMSRLAEVIEAVSIPVVGIGGINASNAAAAFSAGAAGVAVIRAVLDAADPGAATRALLGSSALPPPARAGG